MDNKVEIRKRNLAYFWALITILASVVIGAGVVVQSSHILPIFLAILAVLFGPICGILYLAEIKKGVLSVDDEENKE